MGSLEPWREKRSAIFAMVASTEGASNLDKILKYSKMVGDHRSRLKIFMVSSLEMDEGKVDVSFKGLIVGFLQKSYSYVKRICQNVDIFVYA